MHTLFAVSDNERLYLSGGANAGLMDVSLPQDAFAHNRYEQALMRHLDLLGAAYSSFEMRSLDGGEEINKERGEYDTDESLPISEASEQELLGENVPAKFGRTASSTRRTELKRLETSKADAEEDETRSPFGDVISSVHEILQARNAGRYMPAPRDKAEIRREQQKQRPVTLHPATTLRYYTPPNKNTSNNQRGRQPYRSTQQYPAAVPQNGVFDVMPSEVRGYYERVQAYLSHDALLPRGATLIAAVSGGVDSLAMLDMLVWLQEAHRYKIIVLHFNHRLRGAESDQDEYFVRETAKRYGLACYVASADVGLVSRTERFSLEHAARTVRYNALEFIARKVSADAVCTAHTLNDSVETMMLNLMRGAGLAGLSGIPSERSLGTGGKIIRPLLEMKKAELLKYADLRKLLWREDASNTLMMFTRNKIRHDLLPKLESEYSSGIVDVLHRTAHILHGADELVNETVERLFAYVLVNDESQPYIGLRVSYLRLQTPFLQSEIVRRAMLKRFGVSLNYDAVEKVLALCSAETGTKADISRSYFGVRDRDMLMLSERLQVTDINVRVEKNNQYNFGGWRIFLDEIDRKNVKFTADPAVEFFDSDKLPYLLTLRRWQAGDSFAPLGMKGTMKVSDFLTNSKITFFNRQHVLALTAMLPEGEQILWLCGLRMSEPYKVMPETRRVLRVEFRRPKMQTASVVDEEEEDL